MIRTSRKFRDILVITFHDPLRALIITLERFRRGSPGMKRRVCDWHRANYLAEHLRLLYTLLHHVVIKRENTEYIYTYTYMHIDAHHRASVGLNTISGWPISSSGPSGFRNFFNIFYIQFRLSHIYKLNNETIIFLSMKFYRIISKNNIMDKFKKYCNEIGTYRMLFVWDCYFKRSLIFSIHFFRLTIL